MNKLRNKTRTAQRSLPVFAAENLPVPIVPPSNEKVSTAFPSGVAAEGWSTGSRVTRVYRARGFSLVAALFLLVVVAALGAFAVRIGASQQQTVNLALLNAKALAAANSGIEFGAYQALNVVGGCASVTLNLTEAGLNGFTVAVTCSGSAHAESGGTANIYRIDATSSSGNYGTPDYVSRHVFATFTSMP